MSVQPDKWRVVSREKIADCRVFEVSARGSVDENGREGTFFVIESPDWVNVIPVTEAGRIVLIEQFRHGTEELTLEIPGGMVDEGETPAECAARELTEETGYVADELVYLGKSRPNPAIQNNWIHHFAAFGCTNDGKQSFDEHEKIAVREVGPEDLDRLIESGSITHSLVLAGILRFKGVHGGRKEFTYES
ncbi:MAG: NUDIX hydrolase [Acidobacteriota bacterium]|nr:MAG: NUDIX hydrolase [Acidobacteriota bacterium]